MPKITLVFYGRIPTKKNRYRAVVRGSGRHKGKAALVKDERLTASLDYLVRQISPELWDLKLIHPSLTLARFGADSDGAANSGSDRDGCLTTLLDILVRVGIIEDDSDLYNNGRWTVEPTQPADDLRTELTLETPNL